MKLVRLNPDDALLVECGASTISQNAINIAERACAMFGIKSIVVIHDNLLIQVNRHRVVRPEFPNAQEE